MPSPQQRLAEKLLSLREELATRVAARQLEEQPSWLERYGEVGRRRCLEDAHFHLQYLEEAVRMNAPRLFTAYVDWARHVLEKRNIPWSDLQRNLEILREELASVFGEAEGAVFDVFFQQAFEEREYDGESFLAGTPQEPLARAYLEALLGTDRRAALEIVDHARKNGLSIRELYLQVFQPVQREIGRLWQNNEISVAVEHYCTASTQAIIAQFYPHILTTPRIGRKVVVACVGSELHEIGTRMVADFFEMEGWDGIYVGANTPGPALVELVARERPDLVALGVTMTYHLATAGKLVERLRADSRSASTKIIVGGYVFQEHTDLWKSLGVDGSAADAAGAVELARQLVHAP